MYEWACASGAVHRTLTLLSSTEVISHSVHRTIVLVGYGTGTVPGTNGLRYRFLGFVVGLNLHFGDPERVRAMALVPRPRNKKGARRFIGGTGFYSEHFDVLRACLALIMIVSLGQVCDLMNNDFG